VAVRFDTLRSATREDLVRLARRRFMRGERIDVQSLADELNVSRATAYRWAGNADRLVGTVIASLAEETFLLARREARGRGYARLVDLHRRGTRYMATSKPYRTWIASEDPETVLRIVASKHHPAQATSMRLWEETLRDEAARGVISLPLDAHTMAYAVVRLGESFLYADLIAGEEPDVDSAVETFKLLVRPA
jgi:AcrR family transcriptional regulator